MRVLWTTSVINARLLLGVGCVSWKKGTLLPLRATNSFNFCSLILKATWILLSKSARSIMCTTVCFRTMKQHFYVEDHKPNTHIYCSDCHMRLKDNGSGNLATHRLALGISAFFLPTRLEGGGGGGFSEFKNSYGVWRLPWKDWLRVRATRFSTSVFFMNQFPPSRWVYH
jgi:hypothetical protein